MRFRHGPYFCDLLRDSKAGKSQAQGQEQVVIFKWTRIDSSNECAIDHFEYNEISRSAILSLTLIASFP